MHRYTQEQKEFIGSICEGLTVDEIHENFIMRYGVEVTKKSIIGIMYRNNFKNHMQGYKTRIKKGQKPWNKGKKGLQTGGEEGWFEKGNMPPTHKTVGSETIMDGVIWLKIAEPNVWKKKHQVVWEEENGPIPDKTIVQFADGNKMNVTPENLFLVQRRVFTSVMKRGIKSDVPEINKTIHQLAQLELTIKDVENRRK